MGTALQIGTVRKRKTGKKNKKTKSTVSFCLKFSVQQQPTVVHLCQVEDEHTCRGFVEETHFEKREKKGKEKKRTTMADQYIPIFVVWLLLRCSGLYQSTRTMKMELHCQVLSRWNC